MAAGRPAPARCRSAIAGVRDPLPARLRAGQRDLRSEAELVAAGWAFRPKRLGGRAHPRPLPHAGGELGGSKPTPTPISRLTLQVGAFKERAAAEAIVKRLKGKGYSAYLVPVSEGLFNVRVGSFTDREDAERVLAKLETQEKFKPFIVKP